MSPKLALYYQSENPSLKISTPAKHKQKEGQEKASTESLDIIKILLLLLRCLILIQIKYKW